MPGLAEFLLNGGVGIAAFFGGRHWEKRDRLGHIINEKTNNLIKDIYQLSNASTKFYIHNMDERTTAAETALIGHSIKRINIDLHSLCLVAKLDTADFHTVLGGFHQAVTADPYGAKNITPVDANDSRISEIRIAEEAFTRKLKTIEKV